MAEEFARNRQYEYRSNSNLVLTAERDKRRPMDEATGEVESLHGKIQGWWRAVGVARGGGGCPGEIAVCFVCREVCAQRNVTNANPIPTR